jgi:DNA-binding transcriptional MerR regulator
MAVRLPPRDERDVLKIGELAEELNTTPRTIRLYEELGLIAPERTSGGTRLYRAKDAKRLAAALRLARLGRELSDLQRLSQLRGQCASGAEAANRIRPLLNELQAWTDAQMKELQAMRSELQKAGQLIQKCARCPNRPNRRDCPRCPMDLEPGLSDLARLIWDPDRP